MPAVQFERASDARANWKELLDAAIEGVPATVRRDESLVAIVNADRLRYFLQSLGPRAVVVSENGAWTLFFPGLPLAAEGESLDELVEDAVEVLREYADDWSDRLHRAPNHTNNWGLVQFIALSSDDELQDWLRGFAK